MGLLASCWLIIEYIVIPTENNGSLRWFYLSFYINPFFLFFCRIFLCFKWLQNHLFVLLVFVYRVASFFLSFAIFIYSTCVEYLCTFSMFNSMTSSEVVNDEVPLSVEKDDVSEITNVQNQIVLFRCDHQVRERLRKKGFFGVEACYKFIDTVVDDYDLVGQEQDDVEDSSDCTCSSLEQDDVEDLSNSTGASLSDDRDMAMDVVSLSDHRELEMSMHLASTFCCSDSTGGITEQESKGPSVEEEEDDIFYKNYVEKMRWFDVLMLDRTCGISAILNKPFVGHASLESTEPMDFSSKYMSLGNHNVASERLLKSLESDLEMVYVAQACLSWEALQYQYRKVEALERFSSNGVFYENIAERFQNFQILLERFLENERCYKGKKYYNYVQKRSSFKSLLQVPQVSGFVEEAREGLIKGNGTRAGIVLKSIKKCMKAFELHINTEDDEQKPLWKLKNLLWTYDYSPLEDPRDFNLLCQLTNALQKKKQLLKNSKGKKKKSWLRGRSAIQNASTEFDDKEMEELFMTIDMKLVSMVLKMSLITTPQLRWCLEKLNNINFIQGKLVRAAVNTPLFPS